MATIVPSELAPDEAVHYLLANEEIDLGPGDSLEDVEDRNVISSAQAHPWLEVEDAEEVTAPIENAESPAPDLSPAELFQPESQDGDEE